MSAERPECIEQIRAESRGIAYRPAKRKWAPPAPPDPQAPGALFTVCTGNRWIDLGEREPEAKMLFGELWHQGELCIMFADTNTGKSVLAVQIADNIARSRNTGPFVCGAKGETVLYIDFELSKSQFYQRYSQKRAGYTFTDKFFRAQFNPGTDIPDNFNSYDDFLIAGIEQKLELVKATVLIIDNITCLRGGTESAAVALKLMNNLKSLRADHKLSILVLAHTPKRRNPARPLSADDLHGSKLLINFADSAFALGKSKTQKSLRYLKQIKQRNTQEVYGEDNVCLCRIEKPGDFIRFKFEGNSAEQQHLRAIGAPGNTDTALSREELSKKIAELTGAGTSQRQIALRLGIGLGTVNKIMQEENGS
jgi:archaellum biogenesis ATPase FlaH